MTIWAKTFGILGSVNAALAIILGAFGAHALKDRLSPELLATYQTGVQYHLYHGLGLLLVAALVSYAPRSIASKWSGLVMQVGILLFSGSLYALSLSGIRWIGAITPFGGLAFITAWVLLALAIWRA